MKYVTLGQTGVQISQICLGTAFRGQWDDEVCAQVVERALERGVNFIDTANVYGEDRVGHAEHVLSKVLKGKRDQVILATKIFHPVGSGVNDRGLGRVHLMREIDRSLQRLDTDYVDVLYLHEPDPDTPLESALRSADLIVKQGKARYIGLSRFSAWEAQKALAFAEDQHLDPVAVIEHRYNLIYREAEIELLPFLGDSGLGFTVCYPLGIGLLTGRFRSDQAPPADTPWAKGYHGFEQLMTGQTDQVVDELQAIAEERNRTPAQVAMAWLLSHPEVTSVIMGPDTPDHVDENVGAADIDLTEDERRRLDERSAPTWVVRP